jgi:ubiquitin carboxyl-terminal hydrolase L5
VSLLLNREAEVDIGKELKEFKEFAGEFPPEVCWCNIAHAGNDD